MLPPNIRPTASSLQSFGFWLGRLRCPLGLLGVGLALNVGCSDDANVDGDAPQGGSAGTPPSSAGTSASGSGGVAAAGAAGAVGNGGSSGSGAGSAAGGASAGMGGSGGNGGAAGAGGVSAGAGGTGGSGPMKSGGCGKARTLQDGSQTLQSDGSERRYTLRVPADYDRERPYRLILGFHGAGGKSTDVAPSYFGLWELSEGSTIFAAPDAVDGLWKAAADTTMVTDLIDQLKGDLCIDTAHIAIEGFSQGGAMVWTLACALPGKFSAAVVHSGGGLPMPTTCQPIPFWSALGNDGSDQTMSSDFFAKANGCMVKPLPTPSAGAHACTDYEGCSAGHATRWCDYDGPHTPSHADPGQSKSWVPEEVWNFVKKF